MDELLQSLTQQSFKDFEVIVVEILFKLDIIKSELYMMKKFRVTVAILDRFAIKVMKP